MGLQGMIVAAALAASPLPGAEQLFQPLRPRIVWVGEFHGSEEQPRLFADLVKAAALTGRHVVVALEREQTEQASWDAFLASPGDTGSLRTFLKDGAWQAPIQDGRGSRAMLELAETLRSLHRQGRVSDVRLIMPTDPSLGEDAYEGAMGAAVDAAAKSHPDAVVLAYSGTAHASHGDRTSKGVTYTFAAGHLPRSAVTSIFIEGGAGSAWNCQADCGPHPTDGYPAHLRGVAFSREKPGYDAIAWTGLPTTPSPPAAAPPIRAKLRH